MATKKTDNKKQPIVRWADMTVQELASALKEKQLLLAKKKLDLKTGKLPNRKEVFFLRKEIARIQTSATSKMRLNSVKLEAKS